MPVIPPRQKRSQRPETDSKRWLPQEAQDSTPGHLPLYDMRVQRIDGYKKTEKNHNRFWYGQDGSWRHMHKAPPAYGYIVQLHNPSSSIAPAAPCLSFLSTMYSVLCFVLLAAILITAAKAPPKRRGRGRL
ncbi:predicted protein [Aspergillus terreus NIH2624]|uniref:Uncharacterized protein n=1 Tax=Aspergillus terreus (strain NIH 2624 / FGSC A1156) TaxID=341663 RepID=Q0CYI5_ASPTN|nr:uncharacterized protein ATEG_01249 [Aspergillus terreus NIH2624]EAU38006.1 predicted protein [Aspergillus terreus NIH2624]